MQVNWIEYEIGVGVDDEAKGGAWAMQFDIRLTGKAAMVAAIRVDAPQYSLDEWLDLVDGRADLAEDVRNRRVGADDYLVVRQACNGVAVHEVYLPRDMLAEKIRTALHTAVTRRLRFAPARPASPRWAPWAGLKGLAAAGRRATGWAGRHIPAPAHPRD